MDSALHIIGWSCLFYVVYLLVTLPGLFSTANAKYRSTPLFYFSYGFLLNKKLSVFRKLAILLLLISVLALILFLSELLIGSRLSL